MAPSRTQRVANRNLLPSSSVTRERKIHDVGARDEQKARDRREENEIGVALIAHEIVEDGIHLRGRLHIRVGRMRLRVRLRDVADLRARFLEGRVGLEPGERGKEEAATVDLLAHQKRDFLGPRRPQSDLIERELARGQRHHADDRVWASVEGDDLPDHIGSAAKAALPQAVTEKRDVVGAGAIFIGGEAPADGRRDAEKREEIPRRLHSLNLFRLAAARGDRERRERGVRHRAENRLAIANRFVSRIGESGAVDLSLGQRRSQLNQRVGVRVGKTAEKHCAHDAEDRCRRPDPEGQGHRRNGHKAGRPEEGADSLSPKAHECFSGSEAAGTQDGVEISEVTRASGVPWTLAP